MELGAGGHRPEVPRPVGFYPGSPRPTRPLSPPALPDELPADVPGLGRPLLDEPLAGERPQAGQPPRGEPRPEAEPVPPDDALPRLPGFRDMALRRMSAERRRLVADLTARRHAAGLSQTQVAAWMGTSQSAVARLEAGGADVRVSTLERYAAAVGSQITWQARQDRRGGRTEEAR